MGKISKSLSLSIVIVIVFSSYTIVESVYAQSTKPSPPEFTIQMPNDSTIQLVIKNQVFTNSESVNAIMYNYKVKDHYSEVWIRQGGDGQLQSDSETTIITIKTPYPSDYPFDPSMKRFLTSSLIDFQVQAKTGYYLHRYVQGQMPGASIQTDGYWETTFNISETSDWSNTQTLTISSASVSPIPTPNPDPTLIPTPTSSPTVTPTATPSSFQFDVSVGDKTYPVIAESNSTITDLTFNPAIKELYFKANGQTGTTGYCTITIPTTFVWGELSIYKDEILLVKNVNYTQSNDGTNSILQINYSHSNHNFKIVGTQAIPEFSWLAIFPLLASILLVAVATKRFMRLST